MHDNHRDRFTRGGPADDRNEEAGGRWRRMEGRYRREAQGGPGDDRAGEQRFDDDRWERGRIRESSYGAIRDDDYGGRGAGRNANWRDDRGYDQRTYYGPRDYGARSDNPPVHHWHEHDRERRAGHPYEGTYGGTGDSSYFTGGQGSWAVGAPRAPSPYYSGGRHFGADYRSHGYADHDEDRHRGFWNRASDEVASWFGDEDAARRREQDHRGHGPKDYTRSDERIREDANDRLTDDWRIDASNVTVTVEKGEITLNGTVANRQAKRRAEDVVDTISGVKHVQNNLRVQAVGGTTNTGDWTTSERSSVEGGTLSASRGAPAKQPGKV